MSANGEVNGKKRKNEEAKEKKRKNGEVDGKKQKNEEEATEPCRAIDCEEPSTKERDFCKAHWKKLTPTQRKAWEAGLVDAVLDWLVYKDSLMNQAYQFELAPTPEQERWLNLQCKQHRYVYNWAYGSWDQWYQENRYRRRLLLLKDNPLMVNDWKDKIFEKKKKTTTKKTSKKKTKKTQQTVDKEKAARKAKTEKLNTIEFDELLKQASNDKYIRIVPDDTREYCVHLTKKGQTFAETKTKQPESGALYTRFNNEEAFKHPWLQLCIANARNYALKDIHAAYSKFFKGAGYPRRKRFQDGNTFTLQPASGTVKVKGVSLDACERWMTTHVKDKEIKLPKIGWVATRESTKNMRGRILKLAFSKRAGRWWVSCMVEREAKVKIERPKQPRVVGLDLGVNNILTLSQPYDGEDPFFALGEDGQTIVPPRPLGAALKRKRRLSRSWSRRASKLYRRKLTELATGSRTIKEWKSRTPPGPFGSVLRLGIKLQHVHCMVEGKRITHRELRTIEKLDVATVELTKQGHAILDALPPVTLFAEDREPEMIVLPSKSWEKQKLVLAEQDLHVESIRRDFINKLSTWLVRNYDVIICEGFLISELIDKKKRQVRRRKRRREISDLGWGRLRVCLQYKMDPSWYGGTYVQLPADEPSDRTCHKCGHINTEEQMPPTNEFFCYGCGNKTRRQLNTALYCKSFGLPSGQPESYGAGE